MRDIRIRLGLSQRRFAELIGAHPISVSNWERGVWPITQKTANLVRRLR